MADRPAAAGTARPSCRDRCMRMTSDGLCDWCARRLARELDELPGLWQQVAGDVAAPSGSGERVSGSRDAPVPIRIDAVSWTGSGAPGDTHGGHPGDDLGPKPLAGVLASWARLAAEERGVSQPLPTVARMAAFLRRHVEWCASQPWADDYAEEIHDQWRVGRGLARIRPEVQRVDGVPCPRCDCLTTVVRLVDEDRYECRERSGGCGTRWTYDEWQAHARRRVEHLEMA